MVALLLLAAACGDTAGVRPPAGEAWGSDPPVASDALAFRSGRPSIDIVAPADGARVRSPLQMEVAVDDFRLAPSGRTVDGEGHLHVIVDLPCLPPGSQIPKDDRSIHIGDGSAVFEIDLPPGRHELCVQVGDGFHVSVAVVDTVEVTVVG